jgi:hypothetical protein
MTNFGRSSERLGGSNIEPSYVPPPTPTEEEWEEIDYQIFQMEKRFYESVKIVTISGICPLYPDRIIIDEDGDYVVYEIVGMYSNNIILTGTRVRLTGKFVTIDGVKKFHLISWEKDTTDSDSDDNGDVILL